MTRKIVVGLNNSDLGSQALRKAVAFAKGYGAQLKLVHVLVDSEPDAPQFSDYFCGYNNLSITSAMVESYQGAWNQFVERSQAWLDQKVSEIALAGIDATGALLAGQPGVKLCEIAASWHADLIIVGNRGFSGVGELLMGSVSNHVMHHAPCSVFIVHADKRSVQPRGSDIDTDLPGMPQRILVPVDKSSMADQAMAAAIDLAKLRGAEIRLLHVIDGDEHDMPQKLIFSDSQYMLQHNGLLVEEYQHDWNKFIDGWWRWSQMRVREIEDDGVDAICDVMQGRTGYRICEVAEDWNADLIVMGCRGLSGLKELLVGSVSYYVSHRAPCSVMITRPMPQAKSDALAESREVALAGS
ncbi:MAG: universal stress protein [Cyanobacteria bacterium P01_F01_bin.13]